jgi:hypothetical protein
MIGPTPSDIPDALRYIERAQMSSSRRENPHSAWTRTIDIAFLIDLHTAWSSRPRVGSGIRQELAIGQRPIGLNDIAHPYLHGLGVVHIQVFLIGREGDAVRPWQILHQQLKLGMVGRGAWPLRLCVSNPVYAGEWQLFVRVLFEVRQLHRVGP